MRNRPVDMRMVAYRRLIAKRAVYTQFPILSSPEISTAKGRQANRDLVLATISRDYVRSNWPL